MVKYVLRAHFTKWSAKADLSNDAYAMLLFCFFFLFFWFHYESICCGYSFELHQQVDAIQMGSHNICLYKEVDKKYIGCNLITELLDCALIGVCAVIRSNTVVRSWGIQILRVNTHSIYHKYLDSLCWGFTAQSTQLGHVKISQFT